MSAVAGARLTTSVVFVELDVPVEIIAPALRRVAQADGDAQRGRFVRPARVPDETHVGLFGRSPALSPVARDAAGDDVLPVFAAALGDRHDVVEREVPGGEDVPAGPAGVVVARVDIGPRERDVVEFSPDPYPAQ